MAAEWLTTTQAAAALGMDASQVRRLARRGALPAEKLAGVWLIRPADLARVPASGGRGWRRGRARKAG